MAIASCTHLNHHIPPGDPLYTEAWRRVLNRLGEYTGLIIRAKNLRPERVALLAKTEHHILIRLSLISQDVVLRIAPEATLSREIYFGRTMAVHHLPAAQIIQYDTSGRLVPFAYLIENYVGGTVAAHLETPPLLRSAARQVGQVLRRMHRVVAPGWGGPDATGRWTIPDWNHAIAALHARLAPETAAAALFGETERATIHTLRNTLAMGISSPHLIHGKISPYAARCTTGEKANLEALVDPGPIVGGDGLLDLAWGMAPVHPQEWRTGLIEGYTAVAPLPPGDYERLQALRVLTGFWTTCQRYIRGEPYQETRTQTLALLEEREGNKRP